MRIVQLLVLAAAMALGAAAALAQDREPDWLRRPTSDDIKAFCRVQLAPYKVPSAIDLRDSLPLSTVGKVLYRVLREELTPAANGR